MRLEPAAGIGATAGASRRLAAGLALAAISLSSAHAAAHLGHVIQRAERYLKLDVAGREARIVVSLTLGPGEGRRVLAAADADRDGRVSEAERDAYLAQWAAGLRREVPIQVDGVAIDPRFTDGWLDPIGPVRSTPVSVEAVAHFTLDGGEQRIVFEDRMIRREVYERTDVAFRARDGAELVRSGPGDAPVERRLDLAYPPGASERPVVLGAIVRAPRAPRPSSSPWPLAIGGLVALAALALTLLRMRAR